MCVREHFFTTNLFVVGVCDNVRVKTTSLQVRVQNVVFVDPKSYSTHLGGDNAKTMEKKSGPITSDDSFLSVNQGFYKQALVRMDSDPPQSSCNLMT